MGTELFFCHSAVKQAAQLLIRFLCPRLSMVRRERLLQPARQCFQHAMQSAHDIALIAHMVARQDLTGQGIEPVCQSRQQAVEENVRYLHPPVQEVFQRFLMRIKHIDPDMDAALVDLKAAIDNEVWREWCDAVMACQTDRSLTSILTPIVSKLSDMRVVNAELENLVFGPRKEFITMAILVLINIPLVRFINKDWYHTLVATIPGQMVIAVCLAAVFVSFAFVVKLTQPIEYRR